MIGILKQARGFVVNANRSAVGAVDGVDDAVIAIPAVFVLDSPGLRKRKRSRPLGFAHILAIDLNLAGTGHRRESDDPAVVPAAERESV